MQYLLKITIENTSVWRLVSLDGAADISHCARLMATAFGYADSKASFETEGKTLSAGEGGMPSSMDELRAFDALELGVGDVFTFVLEKYPKLRHRVEIMKKEEKLYCLIPSCLVGAGALPKEEPYTPQSVQAYYDTDEALTVDLKSITNEMRALGSVRSNLNEVMLKVSSISFDSKA